AEVLEGVVHPSHVPLQAESEAAEINGPRHHGIRGGLLRESLNVGMLFVGFEIEAAQKVDGFQVLASSKFIGNPLALLARIVEIEHGSDRVHAQPVDM